MKQGREEAQRTVAALKPFVERGMTVVGLEPSCIFGFRDEIPALLKGNSDAAALAGKVVLFEEFVAAETAAGRMKLDLKPVAEKALLHGHCHQKAFGAMTPVQQTLKLVPGLTLETIDSSCCGMAGSFGYGRDTIAVSLAMGELSLLPAVRKADETRLSLRTARHAGSRSDTAAAARQFMSLAYFRKVCAASAWDKQEANLGG